MEEKLVLYIEIHQLKKRGLRISQIAKHLNIASNTVWTTSRQVDSVNKKNGITEYTKNYCEKYSFLVMKNRSFVLPSFQ